MNPWTPIAEGMPEPGRKVLAFYINQAKKSRIICAAWIAAKTEESSEDGDIGEYDEATDTYYDPEGWYEQIDNWDDYSGLAVYQGEITHWMPIPEPPEGTIA